MRAARAALLLAAALAALAGPLAASAADPAEGERIGGHRVTPIGDGIEIETPRDRGLALSLLAGGAVLVALGAGLAAAGRFGAGTGLLLLGLGVAGAGLLGVFGPATVRATRAELVRTGLAGRSERWPREAIAAVEVRRRAPSTDDFKRPGTRPWDVRVRAREGGHLPVRFALASEVDARALGRALAAALDLPPPRD
jgi:hypothetical protein